MDVAIAEIANLMKQLKEQKEISKKLRDVLWKSELKFYLECKKPSDVELNKLELQLKKKIIKKVENKLIKKNSINKTE